MQKAYQFLIYPLFHMSILAAIKLIFLFTAIFAGIHNFLNMNNHNENFRGAVYGLFWGFSHLHSHGANGFSSSIIHNENAFLREILRL